MSQKQKLPRGKRGTHTRVVSRTTSESLRLVESEKVNSDCTEPNTYSNLTLPSLQPKPASSFVVTSVVHSPRVDGGTESPEDESRSDDISRVTDLETPSCSEETYSKDVDEELSCFVSAQNFELTQPLVPFEDQMAAKNEEYVSTADIPSLIPVTTISLNDIPSVDLVSVRATDVPTVTIAPSDDIPAVAPATEPPTAPVAESSAQAEKSKHKRIRKPMEEFPVTVKKSEEDVFAAKCNRLIGRFQVIKVESIVPFHRGRWTCHDYLDNSKHAPNDGWVFYKGRFILKKDFEVLTNTQEPSGENVPSTSFAGDQQQNPIGTQVNQDQTCQIPNQVVEQPCMDQTMNTSSMVPICQYIGANDPAIMQYQTTLDLTSISTNVQPSVSQNTMVDQTFTTFAGENVISGWTQSPHYVGGNYSINTQYQTSIDSARAPTMVQSINHNTILQRQELDDVQHTSDINQDIATGAGLHSQYEASIPTQMQSYFTQHTTLHGHVSGGQRFMDIGQNFSCINQNPILQRQTSDNQNVTNTGNNIIGSNWSLSQYQTSMPTQMFDQHALQSQKPDEQKFTENVMTVPTYTYVGETLPTKLQYQLSVDSALMSQNNQYQPFQSQTSVDQTTINYYQKTFSDLTKLRASSNSTWASSSQYVGENHPIEMQHQTSVDSSVQPTIEQNTIMQSQMLVDQTITSTANQSVTSTYIPTCQHIHPPKIDHQTSFDSTLIARKIEPIIDLNTTLHDSHNITSACTLTSQFVGDGHITQLQHQTLVDSTVNRTNVEINQHALQYYASIQTNAGQYVPTNTGGQEEVDSVPMGSEIQFFDKLSQGLIPINQNIINNASQNILETQSASNQFMNTNVQCASFGEASNLQQVNYDVNCQHLTTVSGNLQSARPLLSVNGSMLQQSRFQSAAIQQIPCRMSTTITNIQTNISNGNQVFNTGRQYSTTEIGNVDNNTTVIHTNLSRQESFDIQGSIANTPPQTPTSSIVEHVNTVPSQNTQIHTSVMQTPPQTPTNSAISQVSLSPSGGFSPVLPQVHPIQSPCMFSNLCYPTPFSFVPVVAFPTFVHGSPGFSQSYPDIHYQRQRFNSVPTLKDVETREIIDEVKSFLNQSDNQNKQFASQEFPNLTSGDADEEFLVVVRRAKSVPCEIHRLETKNVIDTPTFAYRAIEKKEPKTNISDVISDTSHDSRTTTNENVMCNISTDKKNDISNVSSITSVDNSTNTDLDDKKREILSIVQYCLNDICNNALESIEKKVIKESQRDLSLKLQELFKKPTVDKKNVKVSKSLDNEIGRFIVRGDQKMKRYIPPFSNLKTRGSSSTSSLSDTECIKSMTFVNTSFEEPQESLTDDLISFEDDWLPEDPILKVDTTTSTTDLYKGDNLTRSLDIPIDSTNISESQQISLGLSDPVFNLDSSMNISTPDTPSLDTETTTTVVAVSSVTTPDILTSEIIPFSPVARDESTTTTPEVQTKDLVISSSYEEIYRVTSCASSVIDTKIEQAMDMVKTHLMSSMRAEVESLKARIAELMERIHQLEVENDFLKANASPEVLHALRSGVAQQGRVQDASLQNNNFVISSPTQSAAI